MIRRLIGYWNRALDFLFWKLTQKVHWNYEYIPQGLPYPDSKVHGANMGPTWVLVAPGGSHVGPMDLAIRVSLSVWVISRPWHSAGAMTPIRKPERLRMGWVTGATPAKNTANAAGALRNALTACNTLEGTKRFSGAVWISARNGQRTS